ncbi:MAG: glycosyltransferase family 39 protein [Victivallaceae bacterium]|nr:glycosyltransferase family 39 protein [Victivallaceae bacterium]
MKSIQKFFAPKRFLVFFLIFNTVIATLIPTLLYRVLPLDTIEAVIWGQRFTMGNYKHPPLSGWIAHHFSAFFGHADFAMYFLSQICVAVSYYFIYKLAREFFSERKSVLASIVLGITFFYSFDSAKFNVNILHLALWPVTTYCFIRTIKENLLRQWILLGVLAALCLWSKLSGGILLLMLTIWMFADRQARSRFSGAGPYVTAILSFALFVPYLIWLFRTDFLPLTYASERAHAESSPFYFPVEIFFGLLAPLAAPLAAILVAGGKEAFFRFFRQKWQINHRAAFLFAGFFLFFPILFFTGLSFFVPRIDLMWGYPIYFASGILFLSFYEDEFWTEKRFTHLALIVIAVILAFQIGDVIYFCVKTRQSGHFPAQECADKAVVYYQQKTGNAISTVCGNMWFACIISHYQKSRPLVCIQEDPLDIMRYRPKIEKEGAMFVAANQQEIQDIARQMEIEITDITPVYFRYQAPHGKVSEKRLFFAILRPRQAAVKE